MAITKQDVIQQAQRAANREGKPMAVLNLNVYSPLYVVRDWRDGFANYSGLAGHGELVARIDPRPKLSEEGAKVISMARYLAKRHVKEERRREKIKLSHVDPAELRRDAEAYLDAHREELLEKAKHYLEQHPI